MSSWTVMDSNFTFKLFFLFKSACLTDKSHDFRGGCIDIAVYFGLWSAASVVAFVGSWALKRDPAVHWGNSFSLETTWTTMQPTPCQVPTLNRLEWVNIHLKGHHCLSSRTDLDDPWLFFYFRIKEDINRHFLFQHSPLSFCSPCLIAKIHYSLTQEKRFLSRLALLFILCAFWKGSARLFLHCETKIKWKEGEEEGRRRKERKRDCLEGRRYEI